MPDLWHSFDMSYTLSSTEVGMAQAHLGDRVEGWTAPVRPGPKKIAGHYVELEVLSAQKHAADLFQSFQGHDNIWDYMPSGPFNSSSQFYRWVNEMTQSDDPLFYAIRNLSSRKWEGMASFLRIQPNAGSIEVGHISFSPALQRTTAATEAIFLMMCWVFEAGYRRFEWKCNALNTPSRRAAQRLGFSYEGIFRQATVIKGRNRDTAWFAMIDKEWPALKEAYDVWLSPRNFDQSGLQKEKLGNLTGLVRATSDPTL